MAKAIFVTATGTDIGKTFVSALLVKKMRDLGLDCGYFKPALSGAELIDGKLVPGDCAYVLQKSGLDKEPMSCASYVFKTAVSPHLASRIENNPIKLKKIIEDYKQQNFEYLVVEGAGGVVCPFNLDQEKLLLPDVIKALGLDIVVVADAALGTINSVVLTVEYAKAQGIGIKGIILNKYDETNFMHIDNKKCIEELTGVKVIATVKQNDKDLNIDFKTMKGLFNE